LETPYKKGDREVKKIALVLALFLAISILSQSRSVYAVSHGWEEYMDDKSYIYVRYFPMVPYDPSYPTACEEFAVTFTCKQNDWYTVVPPWHVVPAGFWICVYYWDECDTSNYTNFERVYPISVNQYGAYAEWTLTAGYILTLGMTLKGEAASFTKNSTKKYAGNGWTYLGYFFVQYNSNVFWSATQTVGCLSLSIMNDIAQAHQGHHVMVGLMFHLAWSDGTMSSVWFSLGDDDPEDTDCWLTVEQGNTEFTLSSGGGGGGGCPTLFVWNGTSYVEEGILSIHAESDITVWHEIENALALENGAYKLQLRELDEYTSHIDQVKLYSVDSQGKWHLCPLTCAYHSQLGKVKQTLLLDDSNRVDLEPTETIDLKFAPSIPYSQTAFFIFEINGYNMKWMG
jgi:hypothetical protein